MHIYLLYVPLKEFAYMCSAVGILVSGLKLIFLKYHMHKILYFIYVNTNFNVKCPRSGSCPVFGAQYKCNYYY